MLIETAHVLLIVDSRLGLMGNWAGQVLSSHVSSEVMQTVNALAFSFLIFGLFLLLLFSTVENRKKFSSHDPTIQS